MRGGAASVYGIYFPHVFGCPLVQEKARFICVNFFWYQIPNTLLNRRCAPCLSMWLGDLVRKSLAKKCFFFICALSQEWVLIRSVIKRAQTDSRDKCFVTANRYFRGGCLPDCSTCHDQALLSSCLISLPDWKHIMRTYATQTSRSHQAQCQRPTGAQWKFTLLCRAVFFMLSYWVQFGFLLTCKPANQSKLTVRIQ